MTEYQNPNQDPGMERRLILVFVLTFLVIMAAQPLFMKYGAKKAPAPAPAEQAKPPAPAAAPAAVTAPLPAAAAAVPKPSAGAHQATAESETVIDNDLYKITFTNRGALVKSWVLKRYTDDKRQPLELVNAVAAPQYGYPLSLWTYDEALRTKLNSTLYVASQTGPQPAPASVSFEYSDGELAVRKSFSFDHSYVVKVETSVVQKGSPLQVYPAWPGGFGDQTVPASYAAARIDWQYGDKIERLAPKKISGGNTLRQPMQWAGLVDQYFAAVFLPDEPEQVAMVTLRNAVDIPKDLNKPDPNQKLRVEVLGAAVGNPAGISRGRVFVGPKAVDVLESVHATPVAGASAPPDLRGLVDFGFFGIIARPLFLWLRWTHEWVHNWGWSILVLTLVINIALLPLRLSSTRSALKMQRVQPQVKVIKDKYAKFGLRDPRRAEMNQEISALFKKEGVNPAGGCFPLLIQFPFLIAFYTMLGVAIELRHAPWFWVRDLSSPDPLHILPIGIILSTVAVQKMTPQAGVDPTQQRMMLIMMPVMLGVISWNLASGLCLYWTAGNVIAIIQQYLMNRTKLGREMRQEMEKRARKREKSPVPSK